MPRTPLTLDERLTMRKMRQAGATYKQIQDRFNVKYVTVRRVLSDETMIAPPDNRAAAQAITQSDDAARALAERLFPAYVSRSVRFVDIASRVKRPYNMVFGWFTQWQNVQRRANAPPSHFVPVKRRTGGVDDKNDSLTGPPIADVQREAEFRAWCLANNQRFCEHFIATSEGWRYGRGSVREGATDCEVVRA